MRRRRWVQLRRLSDRKTPRLTWIKKGAPQKRGVCTQVKTVTPKNSKHGVVRLNPQDKFSQEAFYDQTQR